MDRKYNLKLDLQFRCNNQTMKFNQFDNNTSDFFMRITNAGKLVNIEKAIVVLAAIKPSGKVASQFIEVENDIIYADLKPNMKDEIGTYTAKAMLILEDERVVTDAISYEVEEDKIFSLLNDTAEATEDFTLLTDMLNRLSIIEISEEQRQINEAERILSEENRKIEEAKRVEAELVRQHEEADRAKYDATRESNENIRKQNESIRLANETNRIDEEAKRVEEENKRKLAEEERKANYDFMTEDEERRRSEANAHKEAEVLRVQAETNRVNEEAKRRTTEQARVSAENTRVSNENARETNEVTRQNNENQRIEAETQRQNRYNSFIADAEANANNFENYTNTAKVKEEERKSNELDRKSQETQRISNENERISNEETRKANEEIREENEISRQNTFANKVNEIDEKISEINTTKDNFVSSINTKVDNKISEIEVAKSDMTTTVSNKVNEVETRFNTLTSKQQQDAEVIDARDGETSLKARLDRDIEKAKQVYVNVEGSHISTDSSSGYAKDVEILGNTIQDASNLADIRSVGDKVEGQELHEIPVVSVGKNLIDFTTVLDGGWRSDSTGNLLTSTDNYMTDFIQVNPNTEYVINCGFGYCWLFDANQNFIKLKTSNNNVALGNSCYRINSENASYIVFGKSFPKVQKPFDLSSFQLEEGTVATPYEPYVEDKLTILSPVQLEKVGDVADRIIEKDGVWGVEKNVATVVLNGSEDWGEYPISVHEFTTRFGVIVDGSKNGQGISDLFKHKHNDDDDEHFKIGDSASKLFVYINKSRLAENSVFGFKTWLSSNNLTLKYLTNNPTFIPLPHSQQVKLRTFANKTNISFLTEIEGTIKAQVPKSLGATVNTHTEQISNLNKELDRVKKLEESTVSIVETESDFTTVEATSNGYFEDVKLEGKTLVNLCAESGAKSNYYINSYKLNNIDASKEYTVRYTLSDVVKGNYTGVLSIEITDTANRGFKTVSFESGTFTYKIKPMEGRNEYKVFFWTHAVNNGQSYTVKDVMVLEGDHTQNPPSYFEGLKSVGQSTSEDGADEIVVSSVKGDGNLFDKDNVNKLSKMWFHKAGVIQKDVYESLYWIRIEPSTTYTIQKMPSYRGRCGFSKNKPALGVQVRAVASHDGTFPMKVTSMSDENYLLISGYCDDNYDKNITEEELLSSIQINKGATLKPYTPHQADKKRLLYYNEETQSWEKPILREWDSIEKHADGKYYYHQRSGEVVLNGSENWRINPKEGNITQGLLTIPNINTLIISDKFNYSQHNDVDECIWIYDKASIVLNIAKSKLSTQDVVGFKQWLQANNVTVVYQLAQEKVYECTNIDLITYANETNYIVESGAIAPKSTLKVHNNISNVVSLLQKKVSLLESNVKASQEVQDMMILETDMRMLDIELALMEFIPMKLNLLGGSDMLRSATYFNFLKNHIINETYEKEYLENVMNKYLATGRINQDEYDELYKMLYPPVYDIELPIEY